MQRNRCGAGLLQRFVSEQPIAGTRQLGELYVCAATQQYRFHQHRRPIAELPSQTRDLGDAIGQRNGLGHRQRSRTLVRRQVCDIAETEIQDGLTPVISTL